jgi:membrane-bound lytic murein transglycosylase A
MTFNPKTIFLKAFGPKKAALSAVLIFSFLSCPWVLAMASDEIPKTLETSSPIQAGEFSSDNKKPRQGGKPTIIRGKYGFPKYFQDDLSRESLRQVVKNQLDAMQEVNPDQKVRLGNLKLTKGDLKKGLTEFLQLLDLKLSPREFNSQLKKKFYFYRGGVGKQKRILFTGYYTPVIEASRVRTAKYKYPLYTIPGHSPNVRLIGHSSKPSAKSRPPLAPDSWREFTREQIDRKGVLRQRGLEVAWLKDDLERFFLHIQGSGWLLFPDGKRMGVRYLAANNHKYKGIGKLMIADGVLKPSESSMQGIKRFLRANPQAIEKYFFQNKRYIFFTLTDEGPQGSGGGELIGERSIATDKSIYPAGGLAFIRLRMPVVDSTDKIVRWKTTSRFVVDQDTGSAIRGPGRADFYFGAGKRSGVKAGHYKEWSEIIYLLPKSMMH